MEIRNSQRNQKNTLVNTNLLIPESNQPQDIQFPVVVTFKLKLIYKLSRFTTTQ